MENGISCKWILGSLAIRKNKNDDKWRFGKNKMMPNGNYEK